jgi:hypothetical protein
MSGNFTNEAKANKKPNEGVKSMYFQGVKGCKIGSGKFRTIVGNSYTNYFPSEVESDKKALNSKCDITVTYFPDASDVDIKDADCDIVLGDAFNSSERRNDAGSTCMCIATSKYYCIT